MSNKELIGIMGELCGYPKCCIESFIKDIQLKQSREVRKLHGTGYIPCLKCNEKTTKELISVITSSRAIYDIFPIATFDGLIDKIKAAQSNK